MRSPLTHYLPEQPRPLSAQALYQACVKALNPVCHSTQQAQAEARWLLADSLGLQPTQLWQEQPLTPAQNAALTQLASWLEQRIQTRCPLQYLLGYTYFYGRRFQVQAPLLIPRPETEGLVELALAALSACPTQTPQLLDLGCGTGVVGLSLLLEAALAKPAMTVQAWATDVEPLAVETAISNSQTLLPPEQRERFHALEGSLFAALPPNKPFDLIVSNPPYIAEREANTMSPEVLQHESPTALFAGPDGLSVLSPLIAEAPQYLNPGGFLLLEVGSSQAALLKQCFERSRVWQQVDYLPDTSGRFRYAKARLR